MKQLFPTYSSFTRTVVLNLLIEMFGNLHNQLLKTFFFTLPSFSNFLSYHVRRDQEIITYSINLLSI